MERLAFVLVLSTAAIGAHTSTGTVNCIYRLSNCKISPQPPVEVDGELVGDLSPNSICSWSLNRISKCPNNEFLCFNGKCIKRGWYCDSGNDCGDNSDEAYCNYNGDCPSLMKKCPSSTRCILREWFCDGIQDCPNGEDEKNCEFKELAQRQQRASAESLRWLLSEQIEESKWPSSLDKSAVAFYLASNMSTHTNRKVTEKLSYGVSIQILSLLLKKNLKDIPSTDLASYVNSMLVTCLDPRKFHGLDMVRELRSRVGTRNYTNPYVLLSLCNAGDLITESDKMRLIDTFWEKRRPFWTDVQAVALMALVCASRQPASVVDSETLREMMVELKQRQYRNGTVETLQTTALVLQAIISMQSHVESDDFDETKALQQILAMQKSDGSFGSFQNTYFVMPVLNCKSLVNVGPDQCEQTDRDGNTALEGLFNRVGSKVRVRYSIWIGNGIDLERNLVLRVPANSSFYEVMEWAGEIEDRFRFEYVVKDRKPYVNVLYGLQDNPEKGKYWFIYIFVDGKPTLSQESPVDIFPKDNEHIVMWYRSGSWTE